jgi:hypothetical protein
MSLALSRIVDSLHQQSKTLDLQYDSTNADATAVLVDVLPYLGGVLGLHGLACLGSSSRRMRHECIEFITQNAVMLATEALPAASAEDSLEAVAEAAAAVPLPSTGATAAAKHLQPISWLLGVAPSFAASAFAAADVLQRLAHLPHVPLQQAQQLVAAGVRIPYAQLLSAASSMVAGVEVWVQAQQQLGVASDIPAAAVAICCREDWVSVHTKKQELVLEDPFCSALWTAAAAAGRASFRLCCSASMASCQWKVQSSAMLALAHHCFFTPVCYETFSYRRCCAE